ncbi:MAG: shikimate kinase [Acidaminococcales bacterium]|jgi:shikimate kinase|nr:shikimate kinase [Acidaminococcales bacterium]
MSGKGNVALVGFMGTGKTTVGRMLAHELGMAFVDTDEEIEKMQGKPIPDIFAQNGEEFFRDAESRALKTIAARSGQVIATGGGAIVREDNFAVLSRRAHIVCLRASPAVILQRTGEGGGRPLLGGGGRWKKITSLLKARETYYAKAEYAVDTDGRSLSEISGEIRLFLLKAGFLPPNANLQ